MTLTVSSIKDLLKSLDIEYFSSKISNGTKFTVTKIGNNKVTKTLVVFFNNKENNGSVMLPSLKSIKISSTDSLEKILNGVINAVESKKIALGNTYLNNGKVVIASTKKEAISKITADSLDGKPYDKLNDFEKLMINISRKFNDDDDGELLSLSENKAKFSLQTASFLGNSYVFELEITYDDMEDKYNAILYGYLVSKTSTNKIFSRSLYNLDKNNIKSKINKVNKCITIFREHLINASRAFNTI